MIVNEAGASVYSASPVGREEFPDFDATLRGTISIGRRLQDPLAELVKIEPQNIGVGLYQHDVNPKQLKESLEAVIASCVNFVGVDLNTASVPLLRHVSGLNQLTARRVVEYRKENGPFTSREQLMEVEGIGPATFTQAAGFLKIRDGDNPLDRTWIHPESYAAADASCWRSSASRPTSSATTRAARRACTPSSNEADLAAHWPSELDVGEPTLHDIFEALARPERDPREDLPQPIFKKGILKLEDLAPGMELKGTVLNVVDFGAFVDIGLKDSGLVHISQLANRYIKSPHDVVSVGDVVTVWVMGVDQERKRVSLTMVKPGTERPRGAPAAARRPSPAGPASRAAGASGGGSGPPPRREGRGLQLRPRAGRAGPAGRPASRRAAEGGPRRPRARRPAPASGGPGRGGPRKQFGLRARPAGGRGPGRVERRRAPRPPARPSKPAPPPPPLSKDALSGPSRSAPSASSSSSGRPATTTPVKVPRRSKHRASRIRRPRTRHPLPSRRPPIPPPVKERADPVPPGSPAVFGPRLDSGLRVLAYHCRRH